MIDPDFFQPEAPPSPGLFSHLAPLVLVWANFEDEIARKAEPSWAL